MSKQRDLSHLGGIFEDRNLEGDEVPTYLAPGFNKELLAEALKRYGKAQGRKSSVGAEPDAADDPRPRR